jgi:hypothetical protein
VLDVDGAALPGVTVVAAPRLDEETRAGKSYTNEGIRFERTDASGKAVIAELQPREYEVSCQAASTTATVRERVVLGADEKRALELRFQRELPPPTCIAGVVVDEQGLPLEGIRVRLRVDDSANLSAWSDKLGRFAPTYPQGREVTVTVGGEIADDDYEPNSSTVPFGTQSVRIRRVRVIPEIKVEVIFLDATTGERVLGEPLQISGFRESSREERFYFPIGDSSFTVKDRPDWHIEVFHPTRGIGRGTFAENLTRGPTGNTLTVRVSQTVRRTGNGIELILR